MTADLHGTALITGASTGIGAVYADRLARRGYDLVLVARDGERMEKLARQIRSESGAAVDILQADLTRPEQTARVEERLRTDDKISLLVNNAGAVGAGGFLDQTPDDASRIISLNVTAVTRLASAVAPRFAKHGSGSIINIASVVGVAPEFGMSVYGATKAFVLFLSQALQHELGPKGIYVQAVLPATTRTEIWERSGRDVDAQQAVMDVSELVDAALVGFDQGEFVTIPPLHEEAAWSTFEAARVAMLPRFRQAHPAERYRTPT
jgi:short-subunit dehydrogenase